MHVSIPLQQSANIHLPQTMNAVSTPIPPFPTPLIVASLKSLSKAQIFTALRTQKMNVSSRVYSNRSYLCFESNMCLSSLFKFDGRHLRLENRYRASNFVSSIPLHNNRFRLKIHWNDANTPDCSVLRDLQSFLLPLRSSQILCEIEP